jgi:hypothetical protein
MNCLVKRFCWQYLETLQVVNFVHLNLRAPLSNQIVWYLTIDGISLFIIYIYIDIYIYMQRQCCLEEM